MLFKTGTCANIWKLGDQLEDKRGRGHSVQDLSSNAMQKLIAVIVFFKSIAAASLYLSVLLGTSAADYHYRESVLLSTSAVYLQSDGF